jgi:insertion element IS1 protein InsB
MLSKTVVHACPHCGSERLHKNGHTTHGAQRAKCLECGRTFTLSPRGPRYGDKFKAQVLAAYQDRMSLRGITRTFGVCYQTIMAWVGEKKGGSARLRGHALAQQKGRRARTLVNSGVSCKRKRRSAGCGWRFAGAPARSWPTASAFRSQEGAMSLREQVPEAYRRRATRSDFWLAYEEAFPQRTHRLCGKEQGETNHAERFFGTLRARLSRLVRKTYSFSKCIECHLDAIHLFITSYNLGIKQSTGG